MFYPRSPYSQSRPRAAGYRAEILCFGTSLPLSNVRFHGESWRVSGRVTEIAETTFMTQLRHGRLKTFAAQKHCSFLR